MGNSRILVTYATWAGSTHQVADAIGETLRGTGADVDVLPAGEVDDVSPYAAVVAGTGIHAGRLHRDLPRFVKRHRRALSQMPVAYFVVCLAMSEGTEEDRCKAAGYLDALRKSVTEVNPLEVGLFAGAVVTEGEDFDRLGFIMKKIVTAMSETGDKRDWDQIRGWATDLRPKLIGAAG